MLQAISKFIESNRSASDTSFPDGTIYLENLTTYGPKAWKHKFYAGCNANELNWLKSHFDLPIELEAFYREYNGLTMYRAFVSIFGFRDLYTQRSLDCSPYDLMLYDKLERPKNAPVKFFYIGALATAQAKIVYNRETFEVLFCENNSVEPFCHFSNFSTFLERLVDVKGPFGYSPEDAVAQKSLDAFRVHLTA
jgi:hypothetical protein